MSDLETLARDLRFECRLKEQQIEVLTYLQNAVEMAENHGFPVTIAPVTVANGDDLLITLRFSLWHPSREDIELVEPSDD